jgi:two-component system sensor histidine kinase MtrB
MIGKDFAASARRGGPATFFPGGGMADTPNDPGRLMHRSVPEALARSLRHEIGDFLQKVYASVAILKDRLPADRQMERGVLVRLFSRAEACRRVLDTAHDFACPITLECQPVDLAQVAAAALAAARDRHPDLDWAAEGPGRVLVTADPRRARQMADLLLANSAESSAHRVRFRTAPGPGGPGGLWRVSDDGPGVAPDSAEFLFRPFFTSRPGHCGLGLALTRKLAELHGGRARAENLPGGGFQVEIHFPAEPPPEAP